MNEMMVSIALRIWKTDMSFYQYPYGPPQRGFLNSLAWELYHLGIRMGNRK